MIPTRWRPIETPIDHKGPAVYEIRIVKKSKPIPIKRWAGIDRGGILCIGATSNLKRRSGAFWSAFRGKKAAHSAATLYYIVKLDGKLCSKIGDHQLEIRYKPVSSKKDAEALEAKWLRKYLMKFCEMPPLNSAIPSKVW